METLAELLVRQHGLLLRSQASAAGVTDAAIAWRVGRGHWRRVLPGLIATFPGSPSSTQWLAAAGLYAGERAQVTGVAALRWHGARYVPHDSRIAVLIPAARRRTSVKYSRSARCAAARSCGEWWRN